VGTDNYPEAIQRLARGMRQRRLDLGLTEEEVAHDAELSVRHYQMLEAGRDVNPGLKTLFRVAGTLETSVIMLLQAKPEGESYRSRARRT
jgi:transcriptional regulator with XRE-family HTH domain